MGKKGLDLCYHQGNINFLQVKAAGIDFIIPRDGWGENDIDPKLITYTKDALAAGIEVPGVYHFIYAANTTQAKQNAERAIDNVKKAGLPQSTVIWCDLEYDTVDNARDYRGIELTSTMQKEIAIAFCDTILAAGYPTGLYVNQDYLLRVFGKDIINKYDIWLADLEGDAYCKCLYRQYNWYGNVDGIGTRVDMDEYYGEYTAGTAKPKAQTTIATNNVTKYIQALSELGDGRYHYWDGQPNGIGCSEYTRLALVKADIINNNETFHAASGIPGPLADTTRFEKLAWNPNALKEGDILWSNGHHVATWDGKNGVYEAAPEDSHGICDNGKTGVGHWSKHTYRNCGTGTNTWSCIYRIIDTKTNQSISNTIDAFINHLPVIEKGSKGEIVKILQIELKRLGHYIDEIDGLAGPNTDKAIRIIQTNWNKIDSSVEIDGKFGPKCWNKLLG